MVRARARRPARRLEQRSSTSSNTIGPSTDSADKDATLIRFFRALLREHKVSNDLFAKMNRGVRQAANR